MTAVLWVAVVLVTLSMLPAVHRMVRGPRDADRAVAADLFFFGVIALVALLGTLLGATGTLDLVLVASLVGFLSALSLARVMTRGRR
ncbi:pesticidal protein Cry26Aa [Xylanimonas oleitrophica]|uniref:Pesticidal protein Cry26Aa n=1 Tax=Xylanimonas oleitrophica TaxID=2607479 RepID=A0A2W5X2F8_9MICO|nr:monovalent cation/H+ antiporter complex subunit F [Xylanimonas oleitrophica]PZR55036.1 pesticidal protein Cry26Aa [Xylanimonas oleitrophica]